MTKANLKQAFIEHYFGERSLYEYAYDTGNKEKAARHYGACVSLEVLYNAQYGESLYTYWLEHIHCIERKHNA